MRKPKREINKWSNKYLKIILKTSLHLSGVKEKIVKADTQQKTRSRCSKAKLRHDFQGKNN